MLAVTSCHDDTLTSAQLLLVITQNLHPEFLQKSIVRDGKKGKMPAVGWLYLHIMQKRLLLYNWVQNLGRCQYKKYTQNRFSSLQKKRAQTLKVVSNSCYFYT
jgi:hypothetical protein